MNLKHENFDGSVEWVQLDQGGVPLVSVTTNYEKKTMVENWRQLPLPNTLHPRGSL